MFLEHETHHTFKALERRLDVSGSTVSLQLVLAGQAAFTRTSGLHSSPGTAFLGLLFSPPGGQHDRLLVPAPAGAEAPETCTVPGEESRWVGFGIKLLRGVVMD